MDIKNKIKAFSLVELVVGITISMILMTSIWIFVNSWMSNIFLQQKSLQNASNINNFVKNIYENFSSIENTKDYKIFSGNDWIIFRAEQNLNTWWFTYIWINERDWYYCDDPESEDTKTNHIFIKNFIPFVEQWENINGNYEDILTSEEVSLNWINYKTVQKENIVVDDSDNIIIWKEIFGDDFASGGSWTWTQLNSPTWIATDWDVLYVSDTLNDRILYMSGSKMYKLLDQNDWLKEPTWLYYDSTDNYLLISNSWLWEVLKVTSDKLSSAPNKTFNFSWINENNVSRIYINFYKDGLEHDIESSGITESNINIAWKSDSDDTVNMINNKLEYNFKQKLLNASWAVVKDPVTWDTVYESRYVDFDNSISSYSIELLNLPSWVFDEVWNYTIEIEIKNSLISKYYFTQWDEKIYTPNDNKIELIHSWLDYPNGIWWENLSDINQFDLDSGINKMSIDENYDTILRSPIEQLDISENSDLITLITKYYKNYNCYNLGQNTSKINTFISKFNIK